MAFCLRLIELLESHHVTQRQYRYMMLIVVWHTFFFLWANFGLFVNFTSELVVPNEVVEMVVGVESIGDSVVADVEASLVMK